LLRGLPASFPAPVLIVQHRTTTGRSMLAKLLARHSAVLVREASAGEVIRAGTAYVAPPGVHLVVNDGRVQLEQSPKVQFTRPSIDVLFESVARIYGARAIGVLLSGFGRDGARGLQAIKARGGTTVVQAPEDARYPYLAQAAIAADGIDLTLPLVEIGPALMRLVSADDGGGSAQPAIGAGSSIRI